VGRDPALDAVADANHAILNVIDAVASRVGAALHRRLDPRAIILMDSIQPDILVD
jgi:hypothetical protein